MTRHNAADAACEQQQRAIRARMLDTPLGRAVAVDIASMPIPTHAREQAREFDALAPEFGIELWPPAEFSHEKFLRDRDHDGWLAGLEEKVIGLRFNQSRRSSTKRPRTKKKPPAIATVTDVAVPGGLL